ncbi:MAG: Gfo/Idh/MocA family oxidoreductase [Planctomycetia bacterium]|nr:Gfo/Idh/MocA family oxidoreductase [Planctomycetia bacterium]
MAPAGGFSAAGPSASPPPARRRFLATIGLGVAATALRPASLRAAGANDRLRIAVIGCGGQGFSNLSRVAASPDGNVTDITVLCDVFEPSLLKAGELQPKARRVADLRRVYDHADEFDAVVVSCCEHTHAYATLPALKLGKHVYCEKPLAWNVDEARRVRLAAREAKVATQMGIQIHAGDNYRRVVELVRGNAIGPVTEVHVWVGRAWGRHASSEEATRHGDIVAAMERPTTADPVPAGLDWDLWLGPAPERPFSTAYFPGPRWYRWWDFGNGTMSDLGSHWNDLPFWALDLDAPTAVEAFGPPPHPEIAPASMRAVYDYPARTLADGSVRPALKLTWYQGTERPPQVSDGSIPAWGSGCLFVGKNGMLLANYGNHMLLPEKQFEGFVRPDRSIPSSPGQHQEWLAACRGVGQASCGFEYSGLLTEANHLGNVAYRVGRKIPWDSSAMACPGAPEASAFLVRKPRAGWSLT